MLECEYCGKHYCIKCLKNKTAEYEAMQKPGCMWFCLPCKPKIEKNILIEKMIEERCELYLQTVNGRLNEIERRMEMQCEIVRTTIGIIEL